MKMIRLLARLGLVSFSLLACGGDDDGSASAFPGVTKWKCYQFGDTSCECTGLGPNDDHEAGGTDVVAVAACPATFTVCQTYKDDFDDWICECQAAAFTPMNATSVASATKCPP